MGGPHLGPLNSLLLIDSSMGEHNLVVHQPSGHSDHSGLQGKPNTHESGLLSERGEGHWLGMEVEEADQGSRAIGVHPTQAQKCQEDTLINKTKASF